MLIFLANLFHMTYWSMPFVLFDTHIKMKQHYFKTKWTWDFAFRTATRYVVLMALLLCSSISMYCACGWGLGFSSSTEVGRLLFFYEPFSISTLTPFVFFFFKHIFLKSMIKMLNA